jgi:formiminotetrahydrofolate cyclodeaminase
VAECAAEVSALIAALRTKTIPMAASDLIVAAGLARAATEGALANVEINLGSFEPGMEPAFVAETRELAAKLRK